MFEKQILKAVKLFERLLVITLLLLLMSVVAVAVVEMCAAWLLSFSFGDPLSDMVTVRELHDIFSAFLLVLIGIELMETVKMYLVDNVIRVEVVFLVAMISVGRHVVEMDFLQMSALSLAGVAVLIFALTGGYYLIRRAMRMPSQRGPTTLTHELMEQQGPHRNHE